MNDEMPFWKAIHGYFDFEEVYDLFVSQSTSGDCLVEIGSFLGKSSCYLGEAIRKANKEITLICVDIWPPIWTQEDGTSNPLPYDTFRANVRQAELDDIIVPIQCASVKASHLVRNELAAAFIDGSHLYEDVRADIEAWLPKVKSGGLLAGHDYSPTYSGVRRAVSEAFGQSFQIMGQSWIYTKP